MPKVFRTRTKEEKAKARQKLVRNQYKKHGRIIPMMILFFCLVPVNTHASTFEGIGTFSNATKVGDMYICNDINALNYLDSGKDKDICVYTPPTMQEILVINTTIIALASMIWMSRLFIDVNVKKTKD